jgi:ABC-type sugar transport system substrate-binding protein
MSSEVTKTRQAIEAEALASWAALYALRQGGVEHRVIEARMAGIIDDLAEKTGDIQVACEIITSFDAVIGAQAHREGH